MKYELIGKNNLFNPIETILQNRGIVDIQSFLNVNEECIIHWSKLININKAVECLLKHIENEDEIFIQYDSDCDGISSSTVLIKYLTTIFPKINLVWRVHEGKEHGVLVDTVPEDVSLVIIPDAGSNQYDEHKQLCERGIDVIVLDHHECEKESEHAIVVNNQLSPGYTNKSFSGVGIVYKFLQALDNKLNINHADHYLDLVAIGNIADMMDIRTLETRYYVYKGLEQINNSFLKALFDKQSYSTKGIVNVINCQFYIVPLINAAVRSATNEEKLKMIRAFLEEDEQIYNSRKKEYEDLQTSTARLLTNIKARQGRLRDKGIQQIEAQIYNDDLLDNKVLIVNVTDLLDKNLTGLVANGLAKQYKRPVLLLRNKGEYSLSGSMRGYEKGAIKDLKQFLTDTGKFVFVEGHSNASGVEIKKEKIDELNSMINEQLKDIEIDIDIHEVDLIVPAKQLKVGLFKELDKHRNLWGFKVEEPLIAVKELSVDKNNVQLMGSNKTTIKFVHNNIEFIKFKTNEEAYEDMISKGQTLIIDVVGRFGFNEYQGKKIPQVIMEDFEVIRANKKEWVF